MTWKQSGAPRNLTLKNHEKWRPPAPLLRPRSPPTSAPAPSASARWSSRLSRRLATRRFAASPPRHQSMLGRGITAVPQRRLLPRIEAKKQTYSSFDELLEKCDKPLLVDFYATWCGPCQFMVSVLEEVSEKLKDRIQVIKIDTEKYTNIENCYQIEALPTFIIFRDGKPCDRFEGAMPAHQLIQRIEAALKVKQ
ncbi:unnamed protein product [Musa hybrid cultivar]